MTLELGLDTFGDVSVDLDGNTVPYGQVIRTVVAQAELADRLGIDAFGVGEHHRDDFAISSPEIVLAAIAGALRRWLLSRDAAVDATATVRALVPLGAYNGHGDPDSRGGSWEQIDDAEWTAAGVRGFVTDLPVVAAGPVVVVDEPEPAPFDGRIALDDLFEAHALEP